MKSIKSKILVFLSFLFSIFFVGSAFSAYIFSERTNLHTDKANGLMDDIDINYDLDANAYTVYFFPSSKWANYMKANPKHASQSLDDYLSVDNYKNYLKTEVFKNSDETNNPSDDDIAKIYGYFPDDEDPYGYKVRYADTCISTDTFDQMPIPLTTEKDSEGYYVRFSGWTANFANAIEYGYKSQGTFDYISSYDELSSVVKGQDIYENASINIPKHTLFVFPILTSGKEYNKERTYNCHKEHTVRIHDRKAWNIVNVHGTEDMYFDRELYFSQEGTGNSAYYFYNNLKVRENEQLYLDFAFGGNWYNFKNVGSRRGGWSENNTQNTKTSEKWEGESYPYEGTTSNNINPLFDTTGREFSKLGKCAVNQPGVYNIYAYICENGKENTNPDFGFNKKKLTNSPLVWYEDTSNLSYSTTVAYRGDVSLVTKTPIYNIYVKIEKITEFGLSGGRTKSLQYVDSLQMNSSSQILPPDTSDTSTNTSSRYYILNNVFLEGEDINEKITTTNKNDGTLYTYPSNVSTILTNDGVPVEFDELKATQEQLDKFQTDYNKVYGDNSIYKFTEIYKPDSPHYSPYTVVNDDGKTDLFGNTKKNIFIQPKKSGFYSVVAKMTMTRVAITDTNLTEDTKHPYRLKFEKCQVTLCLGHNIAANVFLYDRRTDKNLQIQKSDGKFIDTNGNWYAKASVPYGTELTYSTEFTLKDGTTKKLSEILGVSGTTATNHLTNHLTGREFRFDAAGKSIKLRRNYAFYIMPGAWQEGELN